MPNWPTDDTWPTDDVALLRELARAHGPRLEVPGRVVDAAVAAFTWRTIDAELAELDYDSLLDETLAVRSGEADPTRALSFRTGGSTLEVELAGQDLLGQLLPPGPVEVVLQTPDGDCPLRTNAAGFFTAPTPAGRPFRLWCRPAGGGWFVTDWLRNIGAGA
jgi:hypothetical protein